MDIIKFNFYSTLMNQTLTVEGKLDINWDKPVFVVKQVYAKKQQPIIADEVKTEAVEFFKANEQDLIKTKNSL